MTQPTPIAPDALQVTPETRFESRAARVPTGPAIGVEKKPDDSPEFGDLVQAWWRRENTLGALLNYDDMMPVPTPDREWNVFAHFAANRETYKDVEHLLVRGEFDGIFSQRDFDAKVALLRQQMADQKTIENGGTVGTLVGLGTMLLDPTNYVPLLPLGASRLANAGRVALSIGGTSAVQEAVLHAVDGTRTAEDSAWAIGGSMVLGAGVGSLVRHFDHPSSKWHPDNPEFPLRPENAEKGVLHAGLPTRTADEGGLRVDADSIGAARVNREHLKLAQSDNEVAAALQRGLERVFDHASPLARAWHWASDIGREVVLKLMDTGGRLTKGMTEGKPLVSAEAVKAAERQYLAGYQDRVLEQYRRANMALGQSRVETAVRSFGNTFRPFGGDFNRLALKDFGAYVTRLQFARMHAGNGWTDATFRVKEELARTLRSRGYTDEQIKTIDQHAEAAAAEVRAFQDRYKKQAIAEGLMDPADDLGDAYGLPVLYVRGAINANPGTMKHLLTRLLADNPPDEWLEQVAARPVAMPDGTTKTLTLDELKADPKRLAEAMLEWRGEYEQAMVTGSAALLSDLTRRVENALAELEVIAHGARVVEKERKLTTVAQAKALARAQMARYFNSKIEKTAKNVAAYASRQEALEATLADLGTHAARLEARAAGESLDNLGPRLGLAKADLADAKAVAADAKRGVDAAADARKAAETDLRSIERMIETIHDNVGEQARLELALLKKQAIEARQVPDALDALRPFDEMQAALDPTLAARTEARKVLGIARDLEALARREAAAARENVAKSRRRLDALTNEFDDAARRMGLRQREIEKTVTKAAQLAAVRDKTLKVVDELAEEASDKWRDMERALAEATAARQAVIAEWKAVRKGAAISRKELKGLLRSQRRAKALVKRVQKGTPMEQYIDDLVDALRGGERWPSGLLMDSVGETGRVKERRLKWTPELFDELMQAGFVQTDLMTIMRQYHEDLAGRIALQKTLGTQKVEDVVKEVAADYDRLIEQHRQRGNVKAADGLVRMRDKNIADIRLLADKVVGRVRPGGEGEESVVWWADTLRTLIYAGAGAGFVYSAVQDTATAMLVAAPFFPGLVRHAFTYRKLLKLARADDPEAKELQVFLSSMEGSMHLPSEGNFLGELAKHGELGFGDPRTRHWSAKVDAVLRVTTDRVNRLSGLAGWSDLVRRTAALTQLTNLSRMVDPEAYSKLSAAQRANLASLGIGEPEAKRLGQLFAKYGKKVEGVFTPGTTKWLAEEDGEAMIDVLNRALTLTQRRASYVPGYGSVPNLMSKWYGALLLQFQSYAFQFTHSFLLAGTQRLLATKDLRFLSSAATMLATTVLVAQLRATIRGEDTEQWSDAKWASEIVNRSGALGFWAPYVDAGVKLVGQPINDLVGAEVFAASSKFRHNNIAGSLLGPSVGYLNTPFKAAGAALEGDFEAAGDAARRMLPMNQTLQAIGALSALSEWTPD